MTLPHIFLNPALRDFLLALFIAGVAYSVAAFSGFVFEALSRRLPARRLFFKRLQPLPQLAAYVIGGYLIIRIVGPDQTSLYAMLGSVALALGLAAQDLVKDLLGGLVVLVDTPFQIGDRITVGGHYGEVRKIGLRSTKLVTSEDVLVTVPNSQVLSAPVANSNAGAVDSMVTTHLFLPPLADLGQIGNLAREAALTSKATHPGRPIRILFTSKQSEGHDIVDMEIRAYVFDVRYESLFTSDLTRRVKSALRERGLILEDLKMDEVEQRIRSSLADAVVELGKEFASADRPKRGAQAS
jgi:small-conductance mechanosensitive channel